ncbi:MAG: hypothetical protein HY222_08735 [Thaumarchaeota archaeon]|nr:hypothetical protein [Nitrososphaerota archaeon]MBI3642457.1 hypothetical protein [Nitrososphaerota archaeon]
MVTSIVQFEAKGTSKIRLVGRYFALVTTSDSSSTEIILNNVKTRIESKPTISVKQAADIFSEECIKFKKIIIENKILFKYNTIVEKMRVSPDVLAKDAKMEIDSYRFGLNFEFLLVGIEIEDGDPHIYTIDETGDVRQHDLIGFMTTGSGASLAFSELTRYAHTPYTELNLAVMNVYFAKRASERAFGCWRFH